MNSRADAPDSGQPASPGPGLRRLWYTPTPDELPQVRGYLAEIESSVDLLLDLTPETDHLDVGYDPAWNEAAQ